MRHEQFSIRTRDGACPTHVFTPEGSGAWPARIFILLRCIERSLDLAKLACS
jgi:hypothetical protein